MTDTVSPQPAESEPDPFLAIADELHRIAYDLASLAGSGLPKPSWVSFDMHAGSRGVERDDNLTAFAVDTVGRALLNQPGELHKMGGGSYHYGTDPISRGPIKVHVYDSVDTAWAQKREGAAELAKRDAEIERLETELAALKLDRDGRPAEPEPVVVHQHTSGWVGGGGLGGAGVACACGVTFNGFDTVAEALRELDVHIATANGWTPAAESAAPGLDFDRSDVADDPTPVSPARVEPHWGGMEGPVGGGQLVTEPKPTGGTVPLCMATTGTGDGRPCGEPLVWKASFREWQHADDVWRGHNATPPVDVDATS
jgi:hypothetical protein